MPEVDMRRSVAASAKEYFRRSWKTLGAWIGSTLLGLIGLLAPMAPESWNLATRLAAVPQWFWLVVLLVLYTLLGFHAFHRTRVGLIDRIRLVEAQMADKGELSRRRISRRARKALYDLAILDAIRTADTASRLLLADWDPWRRALDSLEENSRELDRALEDAEPIEYQRYQALAFDMTMLIADLRRNPRTGDLKPLLDRLNGLLVLESALDAGLAEAHRRRQAGEAPLERRDRI